jgi:phosphatidate cytidylyltransferase
MAFNVETFKTRALSAVVFVAVMMVGLLWNHWSFLVLFSIIHFGCWVEYQKIMALINPGFNNITPTQRYGFMVAGWAFMLSMTNNAFVLKGTRMSGLGLLLLLVCGIVLPLFLVVLRKSYSVKNLGISAMGLLYISLPWALMIGIRSHGLISSGSTVLMDTGMVIPLVLIASIWINDTMAYIVGSFIGKTPFSSISPKKTWEGTAGGAILCVLTVTLGGYYIFKIEDITSLIVISAIAAIFGTAGDLLESKLKRMAGIKDSGQIMPGHGGFLDRFDSLLLATPFVWLYTWIFNV